MLELGQISWRKSIGLGNNWDQVDTRAQALHNLNVQRLESMAGRTNEVQASVDSQINLLRTLWLLLLEHVTLVLIIEELNNWLPAVTVVDVVSKTRRVDNRQADLEELLLQLGLGDFNLNGLVNLLGMASAVVGVVLDGGAEKSVDKGGLAESRLASNHNGEGSTALGDNLVALVGKLQVLC